MSRKPKLKTCQVCGKTATSGMYIYNDGYICSKHHSQLKRHGKFLERTIYDANEIVSNGNISYIYLYDKNNNKTAEAIIDTEDIPKVKDYKWYLGNNGYVCCKTKGVSTTLHRRIMGMDDKDGNIFVDHIDRNPLNNSKVNLRLCDNLHNNMNNNGMGVSWDNGKKKYEAYISSNYKRTFLGYYDNENEALYARRYGEILLFKEFAHPKELPNIPETKKQEIESQVTKKINNRKEMIL